MTNHCDRGQFWILIFSVMDNLEKLEKTGELIDIIWDINSKQIKTEKDWKKTEVLLESYEKSRNESLSAALSNLRELVHTLSDSA